MTENDQMLRSIDRIERNLSFMGSLKFQLIGVNAIILAINFIILVISLVITWNLKSENNLQNVRLDIVERKIEVKQFMESQE